MYPIYDIHKFIEAVKDKNFHEIIIDAERAAYEAERGSFRVKGAIRKRQAGSLKYANDLKGLLFFMRFRIKPAGLSDPVFHALKPICENLVKKKQFKPEVMKIFDNK